jgi:hypothetical protein
MALKNFILAAMTILLPCLLMGQEQKKVVFVKVSPEKIVLKTGQQHQFVAKGYTSDDQESPFEVEWEATGGEVTATGLYTAGSKSGVHSVMATCKNTGAQGTAVVTVRGDEAEEGNTQDGDKLSDSSNPYFHVSTFQIKPESDVISQFVIKVTIVSDDCTTIKFLIFPKNGQPKELLQHHVSGKGQVLQCKGKYAKNGTAAFGIAAFKAEKELFLLKLDANKLSKPPKNAIPGGYMAQDANSPDMRTAAEKAAELLAVEHPDHTLVKVHQAATQVVSGINYFFVLEIATPSGNIKVQVVMYQDLSGDYSITKKKEVK